MYYSGTVGAAREAVIHHVPALAVSLCSKKADADFGPSAHLSRQLSELVLGEGLLPQVVLNVNVPDNWSAGVRFTRQSKKITRNLLREGVDPRGRPYYWLSEQRINKEQELDPESDYAAILLAMSLSLRYILTRRTTHHCRNCRHGLRSFAPSNDRQNPTVNWRVLFRTSDSELRSELEPPQLQGPSARRINLWRSLPQSAALGIAKGLVERRHLLCGDIPPLFQLCFELRVELPIHSKLSFGGRGICAIDRSGKKAELAVQFCRIMQFVFTGLRLRINQCIFNRTDFLSQRLPMLNDVLFAPPAPILFSKPITATANRESPELPCSSLPGGLVASSSDRTVSANPPHWSSPADRARLRRDEWSHCLPQSVALHIFQAVPAVQRVPPRHTPPLEFLSVLHIANPMKKYSSPLSLECNLRLHPFRTLPPAASLSFFFASLVYVRITLPEPSRISSLIGVFGSSFR